MIQKTLMIQPRTNLLMLTRDEFPKANQMESQELLIAMIRIISPISRSAISNLERSKDKKRVVRVLPLVTQQSLGLFVRMPPILLKRPLRMMMMNQRGLKMRGTLPTQAIEITCSILMSFDQSHF